MQKLTENFLTQDDRTRIEAAVRAAEMTTSGEIVPMIVSQSYDYPRAELMGALTMALIAAVPLTFGIFGDSMWGFLGTCALGFLGAGLLMKRYPALKRRFISSDEMDEEVNEAAVTSFYHQGLHRTRDMTGVLIFISIFEHKVTVLADKGINDVVDGGVWQEIVDIITAGIQAGRQGEAIAEAVSRCGAILSEHFPRKDDDSDELTNLIVEDKPV
jgi:putative membrane protein